MNYIPKVFCIGSHKTGTTSLEVASKILNYNPYPISTNAHTLKESYYPGGLIWEYNKKNYERIFDITSKYNFFNDSPWNYWDFYKELDNKFPDSLFILSIRDVNSWWESFQRWDNVIKIRKQPWYPIMSKDCYNIDYFLDNKELSIKNFLLRNEDIIEYFSNKNNLLVIDIEKNNGWSDICRFLGKDIPSVPFPHSNRTR